MRIPLSWLKEYVDISLPPEELARRLTLAGLEVGGVERVGGSWEGCFVGQVLKVEPHPNADRLVLATVDIGAERLTVVCGAPNVAPGQRVPFAKVGARLIDPQSGKPETLKAARIRGVVSAGMVCSERELGIGQDHTGIVVLPADAPVGKPLAEYLGDTVLESEPTANRPDWFSVLGVAYEVAALTGTTIREPDLAYAEEGQPIVGQAAVEIPDAALCPRYTASLVLGVRIGPSPRWMQDRLLRAGMRPINSVVDVTNYVMLEYGQPLHAFDFNRLRGQKIVVRQARPGEALATLDGQERRLAPPVLLIADAERAVAVAGVMGGANSEVTESTTAILLESASFEPFNTRRTATDLKLRTEASLRFEKGLRPELPPVALRRATQLVLQLAGGVAARGILDAYPGKQDRQAVLLTLARLKRVLGMEVPLTQAERVLFSLGFRCQRLGPDALKVAIPYWRSDITIEDDLVEEVARVIGYDQVPTTMLSAPIPYHAPDPQRELKERVRDLLAACGMQEVITYSLVSREALERVGALPGGPEPLRVSNALSPEYEYLRTTLRSSLLQTLASNRRQEEGPMRLFEIGRVYLPRKGDLPEEPEVGIGLLSGPRSGASWLREEGDLGFYDAKGVVEALLEGLRIRATYEPVEDATFQPGRVAHVVAAGIPVGILGEVHPKVLERFDIPGGPVALFELDLEALLKALPSQARRFTPLPRFPTAQRDVALLVDLAVSAERVRQVIARHPLVSQVLLFDVYVGSQVPPDKRSLAFRIHFRALERTLTAEEVAKALEEVLASLRQEVGVILRG